jgi:hypothetical protein
MAPWQQAELPDAIKNIAAGAGIDWAGGQFDAKNASNASFRGFVHPVAGLYLQIAWCGACGRTMITGARHE